MTPQIDDSLPMKVASLEEDARRRAPAAVPSGEVSCTPHVKLNQ